MVFSIFTGKQLSPQSILEYFNHSNKKPCTHQKQSLFHPNISQLLSLLPNLTLIHSPRLLDYYSSIFCLYGFIHSGYSIYIERYIMCSFVTSFFHLACFQGLSMLQHISEHHFFLFLSIMALYEYATFFIHSLVDEHLSFYFLIL